jgi:hypothetical protein
MSIHQENEMSQKWSYLFISMMVLFTTIACGAGGNLVATTTAELTQPATSIPSVILSTPTVSDGSDMHTIFPSFSLTDPNTVCVQHYLEALSCLDATGWHIYKNDGPSLTIPREIVRCTDGRIYLVDDEIYQVEGEMLVGIAGYVDQGTLACGRGNEIWVSDFSEVRRFDGSTWTSYTVEDYFSKGDDQSASLVNYIAVAPNGNVWVTTDNVIAAFDGSEWKTLTLPGNYYFMQSGNGRQGLAIDSNGVVWVVAYPETCCIDGQLLRFDGSEWSIFPEPDDDYNEVDIIAADHEGRIWASTGGNKIFTLNPEIKEWELRFDVEQVGVGNEWESRFDTEQLGLGFGENRIDQMEFDGQGRLWVTTNYGLGIFDGATWTIYHVYTANLYMDNISDLYILGDGPQLPALELKPFGSIRGKLVSKTQTPFTDAFIEICIREYTGTSRCANQPENVNADGSFLISNVPPGTYTLSFNISNERFFFEQAEGGVVVCIVKEGEELQLGEITAP